MNEPELAELRRVRDLSKVLEGEYASLQRRYREQEMRVELSERAASAAHANAIHAQQHAAEWEQRAKDSVAAALIEAQAMCDQAEDRAAQLVLEHALVRMQLDKKDVRIASQGYGFFCLIARIIQGNLGPDLLPKITRSRTTLLFFFQSPIPCIKLQVIHTVYPVNRGVCRIIPHSRPVPCLLLLCNITLLGSTLILDVLRATINNDCQCATMCFPAILHARSSLIACC
jgi:hypothetical protein